MNLEIIYSTLAGSRLYGTSTPESDTDIRGVCLQPINSILGMSPFEQQQENKPNDLVIYGITKFFTLAADCNPNIVELLFAPIDGPTCLVMTGEWSVIQNNRHFFISRKARHTFTGYAFAQMKRMEMHHEYEVGKIPLDVQPSDFGAYRNEDGNWAWPSGIEQNTYSNAHNKWTNYQKWLKERNPTRHDLEKKYGYDTKHGMHLCRLISEGEELLLTGRIILPRPDAKFLLEVKNGLFTYDQIIQYASDGEQRIIEAEKQSILPFGADRKGIEDLLIQFNIKTVSDYFERKNGDDLHIYTI